MQMIQKHQFALFLVYQKKKKHKAKTKFLRVC